MTRPLLRLVGCAALLCAGAACGYSFAQRGAAALGPLRVAALGNFTAQAEAGGLFASELRAEIESRGRLASDGSSAPLLEGEIVRLGDRPGALGLQGVQTFTVDAELHVRVHEAGRELHSDAASGAEDYLAGVDVLGTEANRRAALRRLSRTLAREVVERLEVAERLEAAERAPR